MFMGKLCHSYGCQIPGVWTSHKNRMSTNLLALLTDAVTHSNNSDIYLVFFFIKCESSQQKRAVMRVSLQLGNMRHRDDSPYHSSREGHEIGYIQIFLGKDLINPSNSNQSSALASLRGRSSSWHLHMAPHLLHFLMSLLWTLAVIEPVFNSEKQIGRVDMLNKFCPAPEIKMYSPSYSWWNLCHLQTICVQLLLAMLFTWFLSHAV